MQFIEKTKEVNYFGLSLNGKIYIDYKDEVLRCKSDSYGHYCHFFKCKKDETYQKIVSMMKETKYNGIFDAEFFLGKDEKLYFMEVNFRVDGTVYRLLPGVNLPAEWCRLSISEGAIPPPDLNLGKEDFYGMTEVADFRENVLTGKINPLLWLWQLCKAEKLMLLNMRDPLPLFAKVFCVVKRMLHF